MKVGDIVEYVGKDYRGHPAIVWVFRNFTHPEYKTPYTVRELSPSKSGNGMSLKLEEICFGYYVLTGEELASAAEDFRVIEFPPPLEEEIKECLTRELVEVRPYEHLSFHELINKLNQNIQECEEILKSLKS